MSDNPNSFTEYIADHKTHILVTLILLALATMLVVRSVSSNGDSEKQKEIYEKL